MQERDNINDFTDEQENIELMAKVEGERFVNAEADYIKWDEGRTVGERERADMLHRHVVSQVAQYQNLRVQEELQEYHVNWDTITIEQVDALKRALNDASCEEDMQCFLNENRIFLVQFLAGGHGRYVIPKKQLGAELIPDFLIAETSSIGIEWHGVELESPHARLFTSSGQPHNQLTHAIQQIVEWRDWLASNISYARSPKSDNGLGLVGINGDLPATIIIGRREDEIPSSFNAFRTQIRQRQNMVIHSYDWLVEQAEYRVNLLHN